jgi:hypothetical protein
MSMAPGTDKIGNFESSRIAGMVSGAGGFAPVGRDGLGNGVRPARPEFDEGFDGGFGNEIGIPFDPDGPTPGPDDGPGIPNFPPPDPLVVPKPGGNIFDPDKLIELPWTTLKPEKILPDFGDIFVPGTSIPSFFPAWPICYGIDAELTGEVETQVIRNHFSGIDVAIRVNGRGQRIAEAMVDVPERTLIRDNVIVRRPRFNAPESEFRPAYPITVISCGNVYVEHNTIQQVPDSTVDADYEGPIYSPTLDDDDMRYAAIAITGHTGNHVRVIGNSAFLFRHCVYVTATARAPANVNFSPGKASQDKGRANYWIFQHNLVAPNLERGSNMANWAVRIPAQSTLDDEVVLVRSPNQTEPPQGQT